MKFIKQFCVVALLFVTLVTPALANTAKTPRYSHFCLGVYIGGAKEVLTVPLSKVFSDFATHGIESAWFNSYNYFPLAKEKSLNSYAKANGVGLIVQMFLPENMYDENYVAKPNAEEELRAYVKSTVDAVNALPDSDAVVGWAIGDEVENMFLYYPGKNKLQRTANGEKAFQHFSALIHEIDPARRVTINHDGSEWMNTGEDEPFAVPDFSIGTTLIWLENARQPLRKSGSTTTLRCLRHRAFLAEYQICVGMVFVSRSTMRCWIACQSVRR